MLRHVAVLACVLVATEAASATLTTTTCTSTVTTGCVVLDMRNINPLPSSVGVQLSDTWTGEVVLEGSVNGTTYVPVPGRPASGGAYASSTASNGVWTADVAGLLYFRVRAAALSAGTVTVHIAPTTARPVPDVVRAVGSTFGNVAVTGTVDLGASTTAALAAPTCSLVSGPPVLTLADTVQDVPTVPLTNRTEVLIKNLAPAGQVWCCVGAGCTPTATSAYVILPHGDYELFPARPTDVVRCRAATGTADINVQEASCV